MFRFPTIRLTPIAALMCVLLLNDVSGAQESHSWLFVSLLTEKKIVTFERDSSTGQLIRRHELSCPAEPAALGVSVDRRTLFASFRSTGQLASFRIDADNGTLTPVNVVDGGADPAFLAPDRSGRFLLTAYYVANKVTVHRIAADGSLSGQPLQTVPTAKNAHGITIDSGNRHVFVSHTGANRIHQFQLDSSQGTLAAHQPAFVECEPGEHPRHIVLHPSDQWAYTSHEAGDSLGVFQVDAQSGNLSSLQTVSTIPTEFDGAKNSTARCEMTPDGKFIYVANRGHDSIAGFAINQETGRVQALGQTPTEQTPRSFTISADGKHLYAAGQASGRIAAFHIRRDGGLERFATYDSGPVSWWIVAVDTPH